MFTSQIYELNLLWDVILLNKREKRGGVMFWEERRAVANQRTEARQRWAAGVTPNWTPERPILFFFKVILKPVKSFILM